MRTLEEKAERKLRKAAERKAHRDRVFAKHPPSVRYAKSTFKKGRKNRPARRVKIKLGVQ